MIKLLLVCWTLVHVVCLYSQTTKTTYFDGNWNETEKNNASYYREATKQETKLYLIQDFYLNGQIQMNGHYQDKKATVETGTFTYYDSIGVKEQVTNYENGERNGLHSFYYANGVTRLSVLYYDGQEIGDYSEFYENGKLRAKANYIDGDLAGQMSRYYGGGEELMSISIDELGSGIFEVYYQDGNLLEKGEFVEGLRNGVWHRYDRSGAVLDSTIYNELAKRDQFLKDQKERGNGNRRWANVRYAKSIDNMFFDDRYLLNDDGDSKITYFPDVEAMFSGGVKAMRRYISENIVYPIKARKKKKEDKVYVNFTVEADGSLTNIRITEGHRVFHTEVLELIGNMPNWIPGEVNGRAVRASCRLPITFTLN